MGGYFSSQTPELNRYGWRRDSPDARDHRIIFRAKSTTEIPATVDLRDRCPPVYDQGQLGSCTAMAIAGAYQFDELLQGNSDEFEPSQLFIYYNEREREGTVGSDAGAAIRDGIKSVNTTGVCHQSLWPYDIDRFTQRPTSECYHDAVTHRSLRYHRVEQRRDQLQGALRQGYPVVFGIEVFEGLESPQAAKTGRVPMPEKGQKSLGGHAILLVGYSDSEECWIFRNSWGSEWGDNGYGYLPYPYLDGEQDLASDFWVIQTVDRE